MFHPAEKALERGWPGRIDSDHVVQLAAQTLQSFFTGGGRAREHAVYPLDAVRFLAPVLHPPAVRVFDEQRSFVFANPAAIVSPETEIEGSPLEVLPRLAAVIGADGELGGYTIMADWRRPDRHPPKDRDFALGLGPLVVTPDELDPNGLDVTVRVDSDERLRDRFDGFDWAAAHDLAAESTELKPGDLLTGPALGPVPVEPGSRVEVEVAGIGVLAHPTS
jgi:Fumarylacetoacetate (FAA) hydrolase family